MHTRTEILETNRLKTVAKLLFCVINARTSIGACSVRVFFSGLTRIFPSCGTFRFWTLGGRQNDDSRDFFDSLKNYSVEDSGIKF